MTNVLYEVEQISWFVVATINYFPVPSVSTKYFAQPCSRIAYFFITIRCKHTFSTGCMFSCNCVLRTSWFCSNPSNPHSPNLYPRKLEREQTDFLSCCRSDQWKNYKLTNEENLGCQFTIDFPQIINLSKLLTTETMNLWLFYFLICKRYWSICKKNCLGSLGWNSRTITMSFCHKEENNRFN